MKRLMLWAWIWSTIAVFVAVMILGTVGIFLDSGTIGNLCFMWGMVSLVSGAAMGLTFGACEYRIPAKREGRPRLSREARKELRRQKEYMELQRQIEALEHETGINREAHS